MSYFNKSQVQGVSGSGDIINVPVTAEGHLEVAIHSPRLPFGEVEVGMLDPVFQSDAVYGLNTSEVITSTDGASGTSTATSNLFTVNTGGTTAGYFAAIQSRKRLRYRAGQGVISRFTMLFSSGIANNIQVVGVGTSESTFAFGYNGASFGILHSTGGIRSYNTLTISVGSTSATTATVQLNGTNYSIAVTNSSSTTMTAYEISKGTYAGWTAMQQGATVIFLANSVGVKNGAYSVAFGAGSGAGSFPGTPTLVGVAATDTWIAQASWNGDVCDGTGNSGFTLVPTYGNVAQISIQYLGFGSVTFSIEGSSGSNNPDFINVHTIRFPNSQTSISITQPSFPFLLSTYNTGTASGAITTKTGSFAGFIAGIKKLTGPRMSYFNSASSSTSVYTPVLTVRNNLIYAGRANQSVVNLLSLSGAAKSTNGLTSFFLIRNATLSAGIPNFTAFATTSCTSWDKAATECTFATNDQIIWSTTTSESGNFSFALTDEVTIQPGETITLAVKSVTATATVVTQLNVREDQ
jgi:hypothetical protein